MKRKAPSQDTGGVLKKHKSKSSSARASEVSASQEVSSAVSDLAHRFRNVITSQQNQGGRFTLFPELPVELRLMIWTLTFEKQHVDLHAHTNWRYWGKQHRAMPPIFPVTFRICQESRDEAHRYYSTVAPNNLRAQPSRVPVCINPRLDSCFLLFNRLTARNYSDLNSRWLSTLDSITRGGLKSLEALEVRDVWWNRHMKNQVQHDHIVSNWYDDAHSFLRALRFILRFTGLKKICFTWEPYYTFESLADCRQTVQTYLEKNKHVFVSGKAPKVKVRWQNSQNRWLCSNPGSMDEVMEYGDEYA